MSIFGSEDGGFDIRQGGWQFQSNSIDRGGERQIFSLGEAIIQASDFARQEGFLLDPEDTSVARWEDHIMDDRIGTPTEYRELKLILPEIDGTFYKEAHFPDENIVTFLRVDDRKLTIGIGDNSAKEEDVPDNFSPMIGSPGYGFDVASVKAKVEELTDDAGKQRPKAEVALKTLFAVPSTDSPVGAGLARPPTDPLETVNSTIRMSQIIRAGRWQETHPDLVAPIFAYERTAILLDDSMGRLSQLRKRFVVEENAPSLEGIGTKNTYFIDEFQSDWHQAGRQKGYSTGKTREEIESDIGKRGVANDKVTQPLSDLFEGRFVRKPEDGFDDLKLRVPDEIHRANTSGTVWRSLSEDEKSLLIDGSAFINIGYDVLRKDFNWKIDDPGTNSKYEFVSNLIKDKFDESEISKLQDYVAEYDALDKKIKAENDGVADAPFKGDAWISLGLKRAIVDAVDNDYEALAWPNAQVLADRWSENYIKLYQTQYDTKMPSIVKKLTGQRAKHISFDGIDVAHEELGYHIIEITPELKQKVKSESFSLFQAARGTFEFGSDISQGDSYINLLEEANLSTFLHETGHFYFEQTSFLASQPDASQSIRDDMNTLLRFAGLNGETKDMTLDIWKSLPLESRRAMHEKVARAFEAYLFEGKAPSTDLKAMFDRFSAWLVSVYKTITKLNVDLTDDVRSVFDRMLANSDQIAEQKRLDSAQPIFDSQEDAGITNTKWDSYKEANAKQDAEANEEMRVRVLKDMKFNEGARGRVLSNLQREQRAKRDGVHKDVTVEVMEQQVYRLRRFLNTPIAPKPKVRNDPDNVDPQRDSLHMAIAKLGGLKRDAIVNEWGYDPKDKPPSGLGVTRPVVRATGGIGIEPMGMKLAELGYIPADSLGKFEVTDFEERFFDENFGNKRYSIKNDEYDPSEAYENFLRDEGEFAPLDTSLGQTGKMSIQLLSEQLDPELLPLLGQLKSKGRYAAITDQDHGLDPRLFVGSFGYESVDEMITELVNAPDMRQAVDDATDARMMELFGDLNSNESKARALTDALHGKSRERVLLTEYEILSKKVGSTQDLSKAAKNLAQETIGKINIQDIKPNTYRASERRANKNAEKALSRGKIDEAADHKRAAILNFHFAREAAEALDVVDKALKKFNRID